MEQRFCVECSTPLSPKQMSNGGKFCSRSCAGRYGNKVRGQRKPSEGANARTILENELITKLRKRQEERAAAEEVSPFPVVDRTPDEWRKRIGLQPFPVPLTLTKQVTVTVSSPELTCTMSTDKMTLPEAISQVMRMAVKATGDEGKKKEE
tara:strand:- start:975 stop:1427 length:453 start_codon:yes stop_codon:yes gene_type:complete